VDIPEELVRAARSGSLVVFVGAGASRDAPASLPSFAGLTSQIADEAGVPQLDAESSDVFLGRLDDSRIDVHERVHAHLDPPGSRPNALHKAIFELALATPVPRIVDQLRHPPLTRSQGAEAEVGRLPGAGSPNGR
jgi:hypothetical protein